MMLFTTCQPAKPGSLKSYMRVGRSGTGRRTRKLLLAFVLTATFAVGVHAPPLMAITEAKRATTTHIEASANSIEYGAKLTLTATVSPSNAAGTVTFYAGTKAIGKSTLIAGRAKLVLSTMAVGKYEVKAVYNGSGTYATSTANSVTVKVTKVPTTIRLSSSGSGTNVTFTAKVSPSGATGDVLFLEGPRGDGFQLETLFLVHGVAKLTHLPQGIPTGDQEFTAVYLGTSNWASSTSNTIHATIK